MRPLKYPWIWFAGGMVLVGILLYLTLMPMPPRVRVSYADYYAHVVAFMGLMVWFSGVYERRHALSVAVALFALGLLIEWLQKMGGQRTAELMDVVSNLVGLALGWLLARAGLHRWTHIAESVLLRRPD